MKLISHRGNIDGVYLDKENSPEYIDRAIQLGYDVEVDVRIIKRDVWWLGHDGPQYQVDINWLYERRNNIWFHAKNANALVLLMSRSFKVFYHSVEEHVPIAGTINNIWSHNIEEATTQSIIPLLDKKSIDLVNIKELNVYGICSDFVEDIRRMYL